ncbi:cytochrome C554 and C-prime [Leptospira wolffii]|uniref:Cytochrome C554 and C-prime n=1 Tax=Leptospira wolffii TaxID=409998 RepID=A0A2M9ZH38_9LEPT|nr:multiheme c-type cytochrome [Leptospira wolffii]PJZ67725.1 cytochrome C554 and C-prime [Leptospira wolffii]
MRRINLLFLSVAVFATCLFLIVCRGEEFYQRHWVFPLESQGSLSFEADSATCGSCHPKQFGSWKAALHSRAVGPGFLWQLPRIGKHGSENCWNCHSPNPETKSAWLVRLGWDAPKHGAWKSGTEGQGIQCAACHLRQGKIYGPPSVGTSASVFEKSNVFHGKFEERKEFDQSEFCKPCHQSLEKGRKIRDKPLMDVYGQWARSSFREKGTTCQSCHMPGREHLWKGISDKETVLTGVKTELKVLPEGLGVRILAELKNEFIGHEFPAYSVPKVYLEIWSESEDGKAKKLSEYSIGWMLDLELENEIFDTRLKPGESARLETILSESEWSRIKRIYFKVVVDPKEYYKRMFSDNWKAKDSFAEATKPWVLPNLKKALEEAESSKYELSVLEWRR